GVQVSIKFGPRVVGDVTGGHRYRFDSAFATCISDIDRVLGKDYRIVVSERDRSTAEPLRGERDLLRRSGVCELVPLTRFRDAPVLTKTAAKIAASRAE